MTQQKPVTIQEAIELATRHYRAGQFQQAELIYRQILVAHPDLVELWSNLGSALRAMGRVDEAVEAFHRALALKPDLPEALSNLGEALCQRGKFEEAVAVCRQALTIRPEYGSALVNLGIALKGIGQFKSATTAFQQAVDIQPGFAMAEFNLATMLLLEGDYAKGWPLYESRWQLRAHQPMRLKFDRPRWNGGDLAGRRILIHAEQGFGDFLQFARYLELIRRQRGGRIVLLCQRELVRLFKSNEAVEQVIAGGDVVPDFDFHCPIASLPLIFSTTPSTIPSSVPYLNPDQALVTQWREKIPPGERQVGLIWAGSSTPDPNRTIPFSMLEPLFAVEGINWVSLQKDLIDKPPTASSLRSARMTDLGDQLTDFADTASVMESMDLVISIDTASAHLAGALRKPTWVLLPFVPDWRWMLDRADSPWYPTMRLFRQQKAGDWQMPIQQVVQELPQWRK